MMNRAAYVVGLGVPFVWLGMVLAISVLETPLKFRAPGITLALGLGIGRLVFHALNLAEVALAGVLIAVSATSLRPGVAGWTLLTAACAILAVQVLMLRPRLDRRIRQRVAGDAPPPTRHHMTYIALEGGKILVLVALGVLLVGAVLP
jgi:hypothetical protein